jgi:uncharacterized protein (DUF1778 family)
MSSEPMIDRGQKAVVRTIKELQIVQLSVEDQRALASSILDPPAPSAALIRAATAHRHLIRKR